MIYYFVHLGESRIVSATGEWNQVVNKFSRYLHQYEDELPQDSWDVHAWDGSDLLDLDVTTKQFEFNTAGDNEPLPMKSNIDFSFSQDEHSR